MSRIYNDVNRFVIDWTLNSLCTYHCSYCPESLHRGVNHIKSKQEDPAIILEFLNKLKCQLTNRSVHIFINGGEPTISPSLETIIDFCNENNWCAYVNTNGSRSMDWWKEYAKKIYKVTISYHPETVVDEEIFEKVKFIGTQTNVGVFTLMYPPLWDKALNAYNTFKSMDNVTIAPSRVFHRETHGANSSFEYTPGQLQWLEENSNVIFKGGDFPPPNNNAFGATYLDDGSTIANVDEVEFVNNRRNKFKGWTCSMGVNHININAHGNILPSACSQAKSIGNIFDFEQLPQESTVCVTEWCMCTADILIPKEQ